MSAHEYNPADVDCLYALIPLSGFAEDAVITIEEQNDGYGVVVGVDGDGTFYKDNKEIAEITIHLMQSSQSNDVLSAAYQADRLASGGAGVVPFLLRDKNGTSLFATDTARITKRPPMEYKEKPGPREWKLKAIGYKLFVGGQ